jgi:hypothetical protein
MNATRQALAAWAGMIGSAIFVAVFVLEDVFRPDFDWLRTPVSEHALGTRGGIQIASFVVVGLLFLAFARGVAEEFRGGSFSKLGPAFLAILGVCILASGPFVTDPALTAAFSSQASWHGTVHGLLGAMAFTLMPVSCFVFYRRFRADRNWRAFANWTLATCIVISLAIVLLKVAQLGLVGGFVGFFQRIALVAFFGWMFAFATALRSRA